MPRKKRCRRVCEEPDFPVFRPAGRVSGGISMTVDEFETIRLVDYEQKTHEECAALMDVSRTTVTEIYQSARAKIADALVNGKKVGYIGRRVQAVRRRDIFMPRNLPASSVLFGRK